MKGLTLTLSDEYIDKIIAQLMEMKKNKNKMLRIYNTQKTAVLVMTHKDAKRKTQ